jgi:hypothetical protein
MYSRNGGRGIKENGRGGEFNYYIFDVLHEILKNTTMYPCPAQ